MRFSQRIQAVSDLNHNSFDLPTLERKQPCIIEGPEMDKILGLLVKWGFLRRESRHGAYCIPIYVLLRCDPCLGFL